ncbi:hypothetical protein KO528_04925 [Saccharophagus degradans]|uniref:hypothetical protein n=1 Tax=Saccharophagus degradans TaxID=86304 RepID=UPI001C096F21|nr:hypothetical protein [Saccharophagus degradans]MBU2984680.1 hypothetical protein [Saccharophagus degradans]
MNKCKAAIYIVIVIGFVGAVCAHASNQSSSEANIQFNPPLKVQANAESIDLITTLWQAGTQEEIQRAGSNLKQTAVSVSTLYKWIQVGPGYSSDVPTGVQEVVRVNAQGKRFPYVLVVPKAYNPAKRYPVEFKLHGGILDKKRWRSGGKWWWNGKKYEPYTLADQITVFPAAWNKALWWDKDQAENLPAILRDLKRTYNIDDNRVYLSGFSNGGSGALFFALKQPTEWAAFFVYIAHPHVITERRFGGKHKIAPENLFNSALYIVNGEKDPIYPSKSLQPLVDYLEQVKVNYKFTSIEDGGHDVKWYKQLQPDIDAFKQANLRDPYPDKLRWITEGTNRYNQVYWLRIDKLANSKVPGWISAIRQGNSYNVATEGVDEFSLMLSPEEVDFSSPIQVVHNNKIIFNAIVEQDIEVLLRSAHKLDRTQLYTAELNF